MTVINFSQNNSHRYLPIVLGWTACIAAASFVLLTWYNAGVDLKFEIRNYEKDMHAAVASNADSKVQLYTLLAPDQLDRIGVDRGLVREAHPLYLGSGQEVAVAH
jgi:hypothetical protein